MSLGVYTYSTSVFRYSANPTNTRNIATRVVREHKVAVR